jgi:serine-type D-Ala-D-Ala carboxypeptidase (penicillin-binding protein 5/6)
MTRNPVIGLLLALASCAALAAATAEPAPAPNSAAGPQPMPAAPELAARSWVLMDAHTGQVLAEHNADEQLPPASLTKLMTSYLIAGEIASGKFNEQTLVPISVNAWRMGGSRMFVREGTQVTAGDLLRGIIVQSGNDATVAMAEYVAGSEDAFAQLMNQQAARLGMTRTHFENASGWPAEGHLTTARDLAVLLRSATTRTTTASTRKNISSTTVSGNRTATCCCGATPRWMAARPGTPRRRAIAWSPRRCATTCG